MNTCIYTLVKIIADCGNLTGTHPYVKCYKIFRSELHANTL